MPNYQSTDSVWSSASYDEKKYPALEQGDVVDVAIIGGGITGITTASNLVKAGLKVVVIEQGRIGLGSTGYSTGNLYVPTAKFNTILTKHDGAALEAVIKSRAAAMAFIEEKIREYNIECGYSRVPWYYFATRESDIKEVDNERSAMKYAHLESVDSVPSEFPFPVMSIIKVENQAQFNPLQYVRALAAAIEGDRCRIYENSRVTAVTDGEPCLVETHKGVITAAKVIQATHTPKGVYAVHAMMEVFREYAVAAKLKIPFEPGIYWLREGSEKYSIRTYTNETGSYLIALSETYKTGHKENTKQNFERIEEFIRSLFSTDEFIYRWAAQNYSPADSLPYIGTSPLQKNTFIATGFEADGLVFGTAAAMILSDIITGRYNQYAKVFDPKRFTPVASAGKTVKENIDVLTHLISDYIIKSPDDLITIQPGEGKIVEYNGKKGAASRDESGKLHVVSAVCPHLGCLVHWNNAEKSWDCPCHGSRFEADGHFIEGPAFNDLKELPFTQK